MEKLGNAEFYLDDFEIIDILKNVPYTEELGNKSILQFIEEDTVDNNFAAVCGYDNIVYSIYKLDKKFYPIEDAGLIMTVSDKEHCLDQLEIWKNLKLTGLDISKSNFEVFENCLTALHYINASKTK